MSSNFSTRVIGGNTPSSNRKMNVQAIEYCLGRLAELGVDVPDDLYELCGNNCTDLELEIFARKLRNWLRAIERL